MWKRERLDCGLPFLFLWAVDMHEWLANSWRNHPGTWPRLWPRIAGDEEGDWGHGSSGLRSCLREVRKEPLHPQTKPYARANNEKPSFDHRTSSRIKEMDSNMFQPVTDFIGPSISPRHVRWLRAVCWSRTQVFQSSQCSLVSPSVRRTSSDALAAARCRAN